MTALQVGLVAFGVSTSAAAGPRILQSVLHGTVEVHGFVSILFGLGVAATVLGFL